MFFFSSRRRHTRSLCDWSSDVCSSDLVSNKSHGQTQDDLSQQRLVGDVQPSMVDPPGERSEERRVGKECRSRWWTYHEKKKTYSTGGLWRKWSGKNDIATTG